LNRQPQLIDKLPIEKMDGADIANALRYQPQLKDILNKQKGRP
jgi:hypothetical protein